MNKYLTELHLHTVECSSCDVTATFYIANFDKKITEPTEKDHRVLWVNPKEYKDKLFHEYQRYTLDEYINKK